MSIQAEWIEQDNRALSRIESNLKRCAAHQRKGDGEDSALYRGFHARLERLTKQVGRRLAEMDREMSA